MAVAYGLTRTNMALLIGRQADPRLVRAIGKRLAEQPEVDEVVDLLTMLTGTDKVLVCARLDFAQSATSDDIEHACVRIDNTLREEFTDVDEVFLEPVPRNDPELRARVRARYGADLRNLTRLKPSDPVRPHGAERVAARRRGPALAAQVAEPVGGGEVLGHDLAVAAVVGGQPPRIALVGKQRLENVHTKCPPGRSTRATSRKTSTGRTR